MANNDSAVAEYFTSAEVLLRAGFTPAIRMAERSAKYPVGWLGVALRSHTEWFGARGEVSLYLTDDPANARPAKVPEHKCAVIGSESETHLCLAAAAVLGGYDPEWVIELYEGGGLAAADTWPRPRFVMVNEASDRVFAPAGAGFELRLWVEALSRVLGATLRLDNAARLTETQPPAKPRKSKRSR